MAKKPGVITAGVVVDKNHSWFEKSYNDIDHNMSLTYSSHITAFDDTGWMIGFDTAHYDNNMDNCHLEAVYEAVYKETMNLWYQANKVLNH